MARAGVTSSATSMETAMAIRYVEIIGWKNAADRPFMNRIGATATARISVANRSGRRVSRTASKIVVPGMEAPDARPGGWFSRWRMFATSAMASSMMTPMASTSPASTIMLKLTPRACSTRVAAMSEAAIARRPMNAARQLPSSAQKAMAASAPATSMARDRLNAARSRKPAGR